MPALPPAMEAAEQPVPSSSNVQGSISLSRSWEGRALLFMRGREGVVDRWKGFEMDVKGGIEDGAVADIAGGW